MSVTPMVIIIHHTFSSQLFAQIMFKDIARTRFCKIYLAKSSQSKAFHLQKTRQPKCGARGYQQVWHSIINHFHQNYISSPLRLAESYQLSVSHNMRLLFPDQNRTYIFCLTSICTSVFVNSSLCVKVCT